MRARAAFSLLACAAAGTAFMLTRAANLARDPAPVATHGMCAPAELLARERLTYPANICAIELPDDGWRPLRIDIALRSAGGAPVATGISVNSGPAQDVALGERWTTHHVNAPPRLPDATRITLRLDVPAAIARADADTPIEVGRIDITRELTTMRLLRDGIAGALAAIVLWWLVSPGILKRGRAPRQSWRGAIGLTALLFVYFVVWALLRPPYQTPDEVQHHMRATAVLRHPWVAGAGEWSLDPRYTNPLALWTPASLDKLFFDVGERLTLAEVAALERTPWPAEDARPAPEIYQRAIASYPTLYYWAVFLPGEGVTRAFRLTPYQSTYAYRIVSAALAAMLWGAVFLVMRRVLSASRSDTDVAVILTAFLVLNPMVPFMSSGINPDAVNFPLATLSVLLVWQVMSTGTGAAAACAALVATAWTKPSGLQMIPAFAAAGAALWALGAITFERLRLAAAAIATATAIAWCGFYAWSPPRFVGGPAVVDRWTTYLTTRWHELPWTWQTYWGTLGWLEYTAPVFWYQALAALAIVSLICVVLRPLRPLPPDGGGPGAPRLFAGYAALFLAAFLAITLAGEFFYLRTAGYFFQGRHLLPASLGLAGLMWHRVRPIKLAFLAVLIAMNVVLLHLTVVRYYTRGWSAVVSALPSPAPDSGASRASGGANAR